MSSSNAIRRRHKLRVSDNEEVEVETVEDSLRSVIRRVDVIQQEYSQPGVGHSPSSSSLMLTDAPVMEKHVNWPTSNAHSRNSLFVCLRCLNRMILIRVLVGFVACLLLLSSPTSLSVLLEDYLPEDLPSLGAADVEWRELFSGMSFFFAKIRYVNILVSKVLPLWYPGT